MDRETYYRYYLQLYNTFWQHYHPTPKFKATGFIDENGKVSPRIRQRVFLQLPRDLILEYAEHHNIGHASKLSELMIYRTLIETTGFVRPLGAHVQYPTRTGVIVAQNSEDLFHWMTEHDDMDFDGLSSDDPDYGKNSDDEDNDDQPLTEEQFYSYLHPFPHSQPPLPPNPSRLTISIFHLRHAMFSKFLSNFYEDLAAKRVFDILRATGPFSFDTNPDWQEPIRQRVSAVVVDWLWSKRDALVKKGRRFLKRMRRWGETEDTRHHKRARLSSSNNNHHPKASKSRCHHSRNRNRDRNLYRTPSPNRTIKQKMSRIFQIPGSHVQDNKSNLSDPSDTIISHSLKRIWDTEEDDSGNETDDEKGVEGGPSAEAGPSHKRRRLSKGFSSSQCSCSYRESLTQPVLWKDCVFNSDSDTSDSSYLSSSCDSSSSYEMTANDIAKAHKYKDNVIQDRGYISGDLTSCSEYEGSSDTSDYTSKPREMKWKDYPISPSSSASDSDSDSDYVPPPWTFEDILDIASNADEGSGLPYHWRLDHTPYLNQLIESGPLSDAGLGTDEGKTDSDTSSRHSDTNHHEMHTIRRIISRYDVPELTSYTPLPPQSESVTFPDQDGQQAPRPEPQPEAEKLTLYPRDPFHLVRYLFDLGPSNSKTESPSLQPEETLEDQEGRMIIYGRSYSTRVFDTVFETDQHQYAFDGIEWRAFENPVIPPPIMPSSSDPDPSPSPSSSPTLQEPFSWLKFLSDYFPFLGANNQ